MAIRNLQPAALESLDTFTLTELPQPHIHWARSDLERRWVQLSFAENQAWLARPDLDPPEFASTG